MTHIPIDIVNIILEYVSELNNNMIITQYHPLTNKEYYKINFNSDSLWRIKSTLIMKRIYPQHSINHGYGDDFPENKTVATKFGALYKYGIVHYEKQLRLKRIV